MAGKKRIPSVWLFPAVLFYNELLLKIFSGVGIFRHFFYMLFFAAGVGLFYAALTSLFSGRINRRLTEGLLIFNAVFYGAESIIQSVYQTYMSLTNLLSGAGNVATKYAGEFVRSVFFGIPKLILFALPVAAYYLWGRKYLTARRQERMTSLVLFLAGLVLYGFTCLGGASGKNAAIYGAQFDFNRATETFGLSASQRLAFKYAIFGNSNATFHIEEAESTESENVADTWVIDMTTQEEPVETDGKTPSGPNTMSLDFTTADATGIEEVVNLGKYIRATTPSEKNAWTGLFEGKNLILIAAESYCGSFISEELTPTLWRLTHNGIYFSDYYQPEWGGSTTTGEMAYLVGLVPRYGDESMINIRNNNLYFTLGNQLQRLGYSSCAFHNGSYDYYERQTTHLNLGYDQWIANETGMTKLCGTAYANDTTMFENTIGLYIDKQPFSIYYMTLSGHAPYSASDPKVAKYYDRVNAAVGDKYKETTKYYICYQMELEESMKILVERLEEAGIADDTVIVMVGDHYPYGLGRGEAWGNDQDYIEDLLGHSDKTAYGEDENTLVIWSGCLEHEDKDMAVTVSDPVFSLDIVPTLSNLFGLTYDSRLLPGRDVFGGTEAIVFWNNLSWVTKEGKYDSYKEEFHPNEGSSAGDDYVKRISQVVQNKILLSRVIVSNDYYKLLFGPDTVTHAGKTIYIETTQ